MSENKPDAKHPLFVTALARGIAILRCFTADRPELGTSEIARMTGIPQPTVWRLCYTLSQLGCLVQGRTHDRLRAGPGLLMLGHEAIVDCGLGDFAQPLLQAVADEFNASVSLGAYHAGGMVIIQRSEARGIVNVNLHIGSKLGMVTSSLGGAWLAAVDAERRANALEAVRAAGGESAELIETHLAHTLAEYAREGFVFNLGRWHPDINAIGIPVISPDRKTVMALTCGAVRTHMTEERLRECVAPALKALASKLAPLIGSTAASSW